MKIYTDVQLAEQFGCHAVVEHNEQAHRWYNSMVECLRYAIDQGHSEVTVTDDHGSVRILILSPGEPVP